MRTIEEYQNGAEGFIAWCEDHARINLSEDQKELLYKKEFNNTWIEPEPEKESPKLELNFDHVNPQHLAMMCGYPPLKLIEGGT